MSDHTTTPCLLFPELFDKTVTARFYLHNGSSDGGALLLKAADRRLGLIESFSDCLVDRRQPGKIDHEQIELMSQRIYGLACGYPDCNDAGRLGEIRSRAWIWLPSPRFRGSRMRWAARLCIAWPTHRPSRSLSDTVGASEAERGW